MRKAPKGCNGGYHRKRKGSNNPPKRPEHKLKQNIGRRGAVKAPKS